MRSPGWTGLPRGHAIWDIPELRERNLAARRRPLADRLAKFLIKGTPGECWGWSGCHNGLGYGYLRVEKKLRLATHVALELDGRPKPSPKHNACHRCDNPPCTNPAHLFWGTRSDNSRDMIAKGRHYRTQKRTHCRQGHEFTPESISMSGGQRKCRICLNARQREYAAKKRAIAA